MFQFRGPETVTDDTVLMRLVFNFVHAQEKQPLQLIAYNRCFTVLEIIIDQ